MIYITGDTHGKFKKFTKKQLKKLNFILTSDDYLIICGDFGLLWCEDKELQYNLKWLGSLPFTILWVQGNHENYQMIHQYPMEEWNGGLVRHIVRDKIILLERGQIFTIENNSFFTMGGAQSHDISGGILDRQDKGFKEKRTFLNKEHIPYRILNESWWVEELPNQEELNTGLQNLAKVNYQVDYIISHCGPTNCQKQICFDESKIESNILINYFDNLDNEMLFKHWYFGHYHKDVNIDKQHTVVYDKIVPLKDS